MVSKKGIAITASLAGGAVLIGTALYLSASNFGRFPSSKFVEIKAFENNQYIADKVYSATELLSLINEIRQNVGPFSITKFIRSECAGGTGKAGLIDPTTTFSDWNGNMDTYFLAVKQACGGEIIPDCDLDAYCCAGNCPDSSPDIYFANSASLLKLQAINQGIRVIHMESWSPSWYSGLNPTEADVVSFFKTLLSQGWRVFMPQSNAGSTKSTFHAYDYGYAKYERNGIFRVDSTTYPYLFPNTSFISSIWQAEPYLLSVLAAIESQINIGDPNYCNGQYDSAISAFSACLSDTQQTQALTSAAQNQSSGRYTFVYPILVCQASSYGGAPYWDASAKGALQTIYSLMNQYNH
jgi:hypothetical protein